MKYDYWYITVLESATGYASSQEVLQKLQDGWEIISSAGGHLGVHYILKRLSKSQTFDPPERPKPNKTRTIG